MSDEFSVKALGAQSGLPGPRGNLTLLDRFADHCTVEQAQRCLDVLRDNTANSPEEFVGMCGVLGRAMLLRGDLGQAFVHLRPFMSHSSWRIRESTAIAIQKLGEGRLGEVFGFLEPLAEGNAYERRAVVAGLCEPRLLDRPEWNLKVLDLLTRITATLDHDDPLTDAEVSLRKALGYGWSVAVSRSPEPGKPAFEALLSLPGKHVLWVVRENLKKGRLVRLDPEWVSRLRLSVLGKEA
jgi:hypothetical protein